MDCTGYEDEREALESIVATLLSLAVLAEYLCIVPFRLRVLILSLLRPAEAVARAFASEQVGCELALPPAAIRGPDGDGCAEAMRLALCFRLLACIIAGVSGFASMPRRFGVGRHTPLVQCALAIAWLSYALQTQRTMAFHGTIRLDTS